MGGGGAERRQTNQMLNEQNRWSRAGADAYNAIAQPQQQQSVTAANNIQQSAYDNFNRVGQGAGWIDPNMRTAYLNSIGVGAGGTAKPGGAGTGVSSGVTPNTYGGVKGLYTEFSRPGGGVDAVPIRNAMAGMRSVAGNGGWTQADTQQQGALIAQMEEMGRTGGFDADSTNRMRGGGVFENYQKTGGYTDAQTSDIRARANSTLPAYYDTIRQGQNRMASIQGGNPAASAAMAARLGRDQAKGMREQTLDTELGISDRVREGQQWGAEAGAQAEGAYQGLRTGNMISGQRGAADTRSGMLNSIAQNKAGASRDWTGSELGLAGLIQEGRQYGTTGLQGVADREAAAARAASAGRAASRADQTRGLQWLANFESGNTMDAGGGMVDLYRSAPGEVNMWNNALLANRGQQTQDVNMVTQNRMQNNPQRDWASTIGGLVGSAGGAMTGLGAIGAVGGAAKKVSNATQMAQGWNQMGGYFGGNG